MKDKMSNAVYIVLVLVIIYVLYLAGRSVWGANPSYTSVFSHIIIIYALVAIYSYLMIINSSVNELKEKAGLTVDKKGDVKSTLSSRAYMNGKDTLDETYSECLNRVKMGDGTSPRECNPSIGNHDKNIKSVVDCMNAISPSKDIPLSECYFPFKGVVDPTDLSNLCTNTARSYGRSTGECAFPMSFFNN